MLSCKEEDPWSVFLGVIEDRIPKVEFSNWLAPIQLVSYSETEVTLQVPNVFVQEYLMDNYVKDLSSFFPLTEKGSPSIRFVIKPQTRNALAKAKVVEEHVQDAEFSFKLNKLYTFQNFIEGSSTQFIKSAAIGVAKHPGKSYNPLFIHGGVGLGKTHILHGIGHYIQEHSKKTALQCITTEGFINDLVFHLRNKSVDRMKRFYRSLDVLLIDDIQFLQNRLNFEDEFCNTFEELINQGKQIVITSDKPPSELRLSERLIARMEWGLVANMDVPDLETRAAIVQHKATQKGLTLTQSVAFFIAERAYQNVRQLEGAVNRIGAYCRLMSLQATQDIVEKTLSDMFQKKEANSVCIDGILKSVSSMFNVNVDEIKGTSRQKNIALSRQIAMYLARELLSDSLKKIARAFGGKTHSTLLHAWKKIHCQLKTDDALRQQVQMTKQTLLS